MVQSAEPVDVLIIGAGLSGVGAAAHLVRECPGTSFLVLESRAAAGGTWDLFRYPGIRSDSDMYTFGYDFKPWTEPKAISDGPSIKRYIEETADEYGVADRIRFGHRVVSASWSTRTGRWTVTAERTDTDETVEFTARWVIAATGYYRYEAGYRPEFEGEDDFPGLIVHPQQWPDDLEVAGKRVAVIGSGATAVTLVPNLARDAAHVTMVQRTPTYIASVPEVDPLADALRRVLPVSAAYPILRWKNRMSRHLQYTLSRRKPDLVRAKIRKDATAQLPPGYDVGTHFDPPYQPWDQRVCAVPDGDLFTAVREGTASVVTGTIRRFTASGVEMEAGEVVPADIIVTATGLDLLWFGGMHVEVDGEAVNLGDRYAYKGMMVSGVPNLSTVTGYTNNSWTLKADLVSRYASRLIRHLDERGYDSATPITPLGETPAPFLDLDSGYIHRGIAGMAKQGSRVPWRLHQDYAKDVRVFDRRRLEDGYIRFARRTPAGAPAAEPHIAHGTRTIAVGGRRVRYRDQETGRPVVLVHGIGRSLEDWIEQHDRLAGLGFRVVSVDLAGFGESAPLDGPSTLPALGDFLLDVLDAIGVDEPAHLVGDSLGGAVVMQAASRAPERVRSLVLVDSAGFGRAVALPVRLLSVPPIGRKLLGSPTLDASRNLERSLFHDPALVTTERVQRAFELAAQPHAAGVFVETAVDLGTIFGTRAGWRRDLMAAMAGARIPTLIVWGDDDRIFSVAQLAAAGQLLPHARTALIRGAGHLPQIERPDEFAGLVTGFWADSATERTEMRRQSA